MAGEPIKIGPFVGGLNTFSDNSAVSDNELVECLNFEPDFDGSLKGRPPVTAIGTAMPLGATGDAKVLGTFYSTGATPYIIASDGLSKTYYFTGSNWVLLTSTIAASAMVQFDDKAWLTASVGSANPGGYWTLAGGFVADANMPKGDVIASHKLRLWVARGKDATTLGTRLYYSDVVGGTIWPASTKFADIGGGDGQNIVQIVIYYQSVLLFRTNSIYSLSFTSDPAAGVVSLLVPGIGLENKDCLTVFESYIYFLYGGRAYEFLNARAQQLNTKVVFQELTRVGIQAPFSVSMFNKRVMFQWWDTTYVFYLTTRSWTRWRSPVHYSFGRWTERVQTGAFADALCFSSKAVAAGGSRVATNLLIQDGFDSRVEAFSCTAQTKNYNYEASTVWKRLFWWAIDASFNGTVTGTVTAVNYTSNSTWGTVRASLTWKQLREQMTWGAISSDSYSVVTAQTSEGSGPSPKTVKMPKALRFKKVRYLVSFDTDGSMATAPVRLNSLMTYVRAKQTVSKTIS